MQQLIYIIFVFFISSLSFAQDGSVNKVKETQDVRKKYVNPETQTNSKTSKEEEIPKEFIKTTYVNPFIGTGGHGHTYPGASAPFGMIQISPDTRDKDWDGCSGYHYSDTAIYGFSHTHLSGVGVPDYCDLLVVPQQGKLKVDPAYKVKGGYYARFDHKNEKAAPGYYEVVLENPKIKVRIATSERSGMHEYTFLQKKGKKFILIDLDHRDQVLSSDIKLEGKQTISGFRVSKDWAKEQHFYFSMNLDVPYTKAKVMLKNGQHKLALEFPEATQKITLTVGISAVDIEGAKMNMEYEMMDFFGDLNNVFTHVVQLWSHELNRVDFQSKNRDELVNFYTAMYHSFLNPNIFSDIDGRYRGMDNQIHTLEVVYEHQYTVFSLWDTYRALHPLFTLIQAERTGDIIKTMLRQFEEKGKLPAWELAANETDCMIGYHAVSVIADAYIKKLQSFEPTEALEAMVKTAKKDEFGKKLYAKNGLLSLTDEPESVSKTLEYAYDDYCIAQFARASQSKNKENEAIYSEFMNRSMNFINVYDPSTKFMRARRSGTWYTPFNPAEVNFNYTEANAYQYSLGAPHAMGVMTDLLGGKDQLEKWLDELFLADSKMSGRTQADITGLIGQYAHGNEPSHHMAYLYNYTNHPEKSQKYVDQILKDMYKNQPDGLAGNEDCGQMSAWYVLSAMGIYQIAPGNPYFEIGRPLGEKIVLHLENRKEFQIKIENQAPENKYIQKIKLNGKLIKRTYLEYHEIFDGGKLEIELGPTPNPAMNEYEHAPTIQQVPSDFIPVPYQETAVRLFSEQTTIQLNYPKLTNRNFEIKYTLDGKEPTANSATYTEPILITQSTQLKFALLDLSSKKMGNSVTAELVKESKVLQLNLQTPYAKMYAAGGQNALIDGLLGGNDYRTGDWQGFDSLDVVAEVVLSEPKILKEIGIRCLEDVNAWIFYPKLIQVEVSYDGINFVKLADIKPVLGTKVEDRSVKEFTTLSVNATPIKRIKITAVNAGKLPLWHPGKGGNAWIFADELIVR